jgi:hypothetical protein
MLLKQLSIKDNKNQNYHEYASWYPKIKEVSISFSIERGWGTTQITESK